LLVLMPFFFGLKCSGIPPAAQPTTESLGRPSGLPLPSQSSVADYEALLFPFLNSFQYEKLGWLGDEEIRDTGPYTQGRYQGTHPAVRVYYSPGVIRWLKAGRVGKIPDGEMIVKEQFPAPAARHRGKSRDQQRKELEAWTVMVKDSSGSHDGWFWSNPVKAQCATDNHQYPFSHPVSGFGLYCIRCHASTQSPGTDTGSQANEFTFASLRNVAGFSGEPLRFPVDDSWRQRAREEKPNPSAPVDLQRGHHSRCVRATATDRPTRVADPKFLRYFDQIRPVKLGEAAPMPPATHDWVVFGRDRSQEFATSNQCMSCHAGLVAPFGPSMFIPTGADAEYGSAGWDVSPYGEWRWTAMGLAGRDPIFYAQVESEIRMLNEEFRAEPNRAAELRATLVDTCLRCHGAMGQKQFAADRPRDRQKFSFSHVAAVPGPHEQPGRGLAKYGALARDGVGCMVCHRMQPRPQPAGDSRPYLQFFLETSISGNFHLGAKGEIFGPYRDAEVAPYAMEHGSGLKAKHSDYVQSSQLCGTCHTVVLPTVDRPLGAPSAWHVPDDLTRSEAVPLFRKYRHHVEQATYLEWLNSEFENEIDKKNPRGKSCQDCHMQRGLKDRKHGIDIRQIRTKIAAIQDTTYPDAENLAAGEQLLIRVRDEGYKRHHFSGLNVFLLELFKQCDDVLGVPQVDFMTGSKEGAKHAIENMVRTAREDVAELEVQADSLASNRITARVVVKNKVGHRFPSGVGFRRAFIELAVVQRGNNPGEPEQIIWASGRTNDLGVILGADGRPLATEFFDRDPKSGRQAYQKHHQVISSPDQVRVYEQLLRNARGDFTTSFIHGCEIVKDNRLLPRGWKRKGPGAGLSGHFLQATHPDADTAKDPRYADGSGTDEVTYQITLPQKMDASRLQVRATLYYQAIPPYYLWNLFETAPDGPATRRLHYLCSHVNLQGTPIKGWKLPVTSASCDIRR
jgi:hypothetical protein